MIDAEEEHVWGGVRVEPGEGREIHFTVSESYVGSRTTLPIYVWRGQEEGPTVFVTAAVHGDELNGVGAIRQIIIDEPFKVLRGTLVLVPVVNVLGFERHSRYLPDRRDLNRSFPGSTSGSLASRMARTFFDGIIRRCNYGIDLHTASVRRTNFPNVRADLSDPTLEAFAIEFGAEIVVDGKGPKGSLRRAAGDAGCPTLIFEAGEVWKVQPAVVEYAIQGIRNCLAHLGMTGEKVDRSDFHFRSNDTGWVRAAYGGFMTFHVGPGDVIEAGAAIATNTSLTGREQNVVEAPHSGVILGMTTIPTVAPGDPICHIAQASDEALAEFRANRRAAGPRSLYERTRRSFLRSVLVTKEDPDRKSPGE